jgi:hypothetical protein
MNRLAHTRGGCTSCWWRRNYYRADLVVLDDVYRPMDEAYSDNVRQKVSEWFFSEVLPRLRPGGKVVGIGTHFHH